MITAVVDSIKNMKTIVTGDNLYHVTIISLEEELFMREIKIIVEKHPDGYVAYPLGIKGTVVGQGDTYDEALLDVKSAIRFHIESFGEGSFEVDPPILEAFVAEAGVEA